MIIPRVRNYVNGTSSINPSIRSFAITLLTGNDTQLWFLNRLIILSLLMPVIFILMKNKWAAIVIWLALLIANCMLSRNDTDWLRVVFDYMTGILIALHFQDKIKVHNSHQKTYLILFSIFGICETYIFVCDRFRYIEVFVLFAMMMALWRSLNEQSWNTEDRSFWLYLSHGVVFVYVKKIVYLVLPKTEFVALTTYFVLTAGIILLLIGIAIFIEKTIPNLYAVMVGGRTNNKK